MNLDKKTQVIMKKSQNIDQQRILGKYNYNL